MIVPVPTHVVYQMSAVRLGAVDYEAKHIMYSHSQNNIASEVKHVDSYHYQNYFDKIITKIILCVVDAVTLMHLSIVQTNTINPLIKYL